MPTYRIWNNTDIREPLVIANERKAYRTWNHLKPGPRAGNAYAAFFQVRCETCGEWQDNTVDYATCRCGRER